MNYYRRYIGDYAKKTRHLSLTERGAYDALLDHYYANDGDIPTELQDLFQLCAARSEIDEAAVSKVSAQFFPLEKNKRRNKRADEELAIALSAIEKMRVSGKEGASRRWGKDREPHSLPYRVRDGVTIQPPSSNQTQNQPKSNTLAPFGASEFDSLFWPAYPRKVAKAAALKAWKKVANGNITKILAALKPEKWPDNWRDPQFIPYPATWLNGKRWMDEVSTQKPKIDPSVSPGNTGPLPPLDQCKQWVV